MPNCRDYDYWYNFRNADPYNYLQRRPTVEAKKLAAAPRGGKGDAVTKTPTIYTWGCSKRAADDLERVIYDRDIDHIIDVRARPRSRRPAWNKAKLEEKFGAAYIWAQCFGNPGKHPPDDWEYGLSFTEPEERWGPVDIAVHGCQGDRAFALAVTIASGALGNVLLLCLEQDPMKCHRSAVAEFIGGEIIHLGVPDA